MCHYRSQPLSNWTDHENYNCEVTLDDSRKIKVYSNWLHNENLDSWSGWICSAGAKRIYVTKNLEVYSGECRNDYLGSAIEGFSLLRHTVCKQVKCSGCTDDLIVEKRRADQ